MKVKRGVVSNIVLFIFIISYLFCIFSFSRIQFYEAIEMEIPPIFTNTAISCLIVVICCMVYSPVSIIWAYLGELRYKLNKKSSNFFEATIRLNEVDEDSVQLEFKPDSVYEIKTTEEMENLIYKTKAFQSLLNNLEEDFQNISVDNIDLFKMITFEELDEVAKKLDEMKKEEDKKKTKDIELTFGNDQMKNVLEKVKYEMVRKLKLVQSEGDHIYYVELKEPRILEVGWYEKEQHEHKEKGIIGFLLICPAQWKDCFSFAEHKIYDYYKEVSMDGMRCSFPTLNLEEYLFPKLPLLSVSDCNLSQKEIWNMKLTTSQMRSKREKIYKYFSYLSTTQMQSVQREAESLKLENVKLETKFHKLQNKRLKEWIRDGEFENLLFKEVQTLGVGVWMTVLLVMISAFVGFFIGLKIGGGI